MKVINKLGVLSKEDLIKKIGFDLKCDKVMTILSTFFVTAMYLYWAYANISVVFPLIAAVNFLIWLNAFLITKRNKQIMEVK